MRRGGGEGKREGVRGKRGRGGEGGERGEKRRRGGGR